MSYHVGQMDWAGLGQGVSTALGSANLDVVAANSMVSALNAPQVQQRLNQEYMKAAAIVMAAVATGIVVGTQIAKRAT